MFHLDQGASQAGPVQRTLREGLQELSRISQNNRGLEFFHLQFERKTLEIFFKQVWQRSNEVLRKEFSKAEQYEYCVSGVVF